MLLGWLLRSSRGLSDNLSPEKNMNIYEGGRRIAKIIYVMIALVGALVLLVSTPYLNKYYSYSESQDLISTIGCNEQPWFVAQVEGRPNWASISICGYQSGPTIVTLNNTELVKLDDAIYQARWEKYGEIIAGTFGFLAFSFALFWCIGWVMRGFAGVPRGQDKK